MNRVSLCLVYYKKKRESCCVGRHLEKNSKVSNLHAWNTPSLPLKKGNLIILTFYFGDLKIYCFNRKQKSSKKMI